MIYGADFDDVAVYVGAGSATTITSRDGRITIPSPAGALSRWIISVPGLVMPSVS